jgi:hypothetical protein
MLLHLLVNELDHSRPHSKRSQDGSWSYILSINDRKIYERYMKDIMKAREYQAAPVFRVAELEAEMENLFTWSSWVFGQCICTIGKVRSEIV